METSVTDTTTAAATPARRPRRLLPAPPAIYSAADLAGHLAATAALVPGSLALAPGQAVDPYPEAGPAPAVRRRRAAGKGKTAKPKRLHEVNSRVRHLM